MSKIIGLSIYLILFNVFACYMSTQRFVSPWISFYRLYLSRNLISLNYFFVDRLFSCNFLLRLLFLTNIQVIWIFPHCRNFELYQIKISSVNGTLLGSWQINLIYEQCFGVRLFWQLQTHFVPSRCCYSAGFHRF